MWKDASVIGTVVRVRRRCFPCADLDESVPWAEDLADPQPMIGWRRTRGGSRCWQQVWTD